MTQLTADFVFSVNGLEVRRELLGRRLSLQFEGLACEIEIPGSEDAYANRYAEPIALGGSAGTVDDPGQVRSVLLVRVLLTGEGSVSSADFQDAKRPDAPKEALQFFEAARGIAKRLAGQLIEWIRIEGQPWLALYGDEPRLSGIQSLVDAANGERLPVGVNDVIRAFLVDVDRAVDADVMARILARVEAGDEPALADSLLADARYLLRNDPTYGRAVLGAAIACEVRVRDTLRAHTTDANSDLLSVLLDNPRDFSLAAAALFDKAMRAVAGKSLKEDDNALHKSVVALFERRNAVAHRGWTPSREEASESVRAAVDAFAWLSRLG